MNMICYWKLNLIILTQGVLNLIYRVDKFTENSYSEFTVGVEDDNAKARYMYEKYDFTESVARIKESYQGDSYEYDLLLKT